MLKALPFSIKAPRAVFPGVLAAWGACACAGLAPTSTSEEAADPVVQPTYRGLPFQASELRSPAVQTSTDLGSPPGAPHGFGQDSSGPTAQDRGGVALLVSPSSGVTCETGTQVSFSVTLRHRPSSDVTVSVASDTPSEGTALPRSLLFTRGNWNVSQNVIVTGAPDLVVDGDAPYGVVLSGTSADRRFDGRTAEITLTNRDAPTQLRRLGLHAFQDPGHRFAAEDGSFFVYAAYPPDVTVDSTGTPSSPGQLWLYDRATATSRLITHDAAGGYANGGSDGPAVSSNDRYVAFRSSATNLGSIALTPFSTNVFVYDRETDAIELASQSATGQSVEGFSFTSWPTLSRDGRFVAFSSASRVLVEGDDDGATDFFIRDRQAGTIRLIRDTTGVVPSNAYRTDCAISGDGRFLATVAGTAADPDNNKGVFVQDLSGSGIERVDVNDTGEPGNGFVYGVDISADGRYVAFASLANNLLPIPSGSMQVFVRDRVAKTTELASVNSGGEPGEGSSSEARLSSDGRFVAFLSFSSNLTGNQKANESLDLFVHDRKSRVTSLLSVSLTGTTGNGPTDSYGMSANGSTMVFQSAASDLVAGDTTAFPADLFIASVTPH